MITITLAILLIITLVWNYTYYKENKTQEKTIEWLEKDLSEARRHNWNNITLKNYYKKRYLKLKAPKKWQN